MCIATGGGRLDAPVDVAYSRLGTVFAGKTLLPGEQELAMRLLSPHMAGYDINAGGGIQDLFKSEFVIGEEKFLLVIGDEFQIRDDFRPSARKLALPKSDEIVEGNCYDWILHAARAHPMDEPMCALADSCLIVDEKGQTEFSAATVLRKPTRENYLDPEIIVYDYKLD